MRLWLEVDGHGQLDFDIHQTLIAGYTGRDRAKVLQHIHELEKVGVAPPPRVPMVYTLDPARLTTEPVIRVQSDQTSGEAEFCLLFRGDEIFVGVGSDHTDRQVETRDVPASKAAMPHPISRTVWRYAEVTEHWDSIEVRSWMDHRLYQEGTLVAFLSVEALVDELAGAGFADLDGTLVFGGTLPAIGGLAFGQHFRAELNDSLAGRRLTCEYRVGQVHSEHL